VYDVIIKKVHVRYLISWCVSCLLMPSVLFHWRLRWIRWKLPYVQKKPRRLGWTRKHINIMILRRAVKYLWLAG